MTRSISMRLGLALALVAMPLAAEAVDTFTLSHVSGPCAEANFVTTHVEWQNRSRIFVATGETIRVTLYSHGADLATGVSFPAGVAAKIHARGTTTNYPNAPIQFGSKVPKGYVTIEIRLDVTGDRNVTVQWLTGNETIPLRGVAGCGGLVDASYRTAVPAGSTTPTKPLKVCTDPTRVTC